MITKKHHHDCFSVAHCNQYDCFMVTCTLMNCYKMFLTYGVTVISMVYIGNSINFVKCDVMTGEKKFCKHENEGHTVSQSVHSQSCPTVCNFMDCHTSGIPITKSRSLLKLMSIESVSLFNRLILCCSLYILPSIFPSNRNFSKKSVLPIK